MPMLGIFRGIGDSITFRNRIIFCHGCVFRTNLPDSRPIPEVRPKYFYWVFLRLPLEDCWRRSPTPKLGNAENAQAYIQPGAPTEAGWM